jgi:hypothetical protein
MTEYTTSSFYVNPGAGNLYVGNATQQFLFSVNGQYSGPSIVPNGSTNILYLGPNGTKTVVGGNGSAYAGTLAVRQISGQPAFTVENAAASAIYLYIDSSGNIGINTTSPQTLLHVNSGTIRVQNFAAAPYIDTYAAEGTSSVPTATILGRQIASLRGFGYDGTSYIFGGGLDLQAETLWSVGSNATYLRFRTSPAVGSGTEQMRITSTGGISFGASGTAYGTSGQILQSNGNASPTWISTGSLVASNAVAVQTVLTATNASFYPTFVSTNNATPTTLFHYTTSTFTINPYTGNVSFGSSTLYSRLTVSNGSSARSLITISDTNTRSLMLGAGNSLPATIGSDSTDGVRFLTGSTAGSENGTELMRYNSTGLGIGTTSTVDKLQVVGGNIVIGTVNNATNSGSNSYLKVANYYAQGNFYVGNHAYPGHMGLSMNTYGRQGNNDFNVLDNSTYNAWAMTFDAQNVYSPTGFNLRFAPATAGTPVFSSLLNVQSSGNVGIGTINPGYKLEVNGSIYANEYLMSTSSSQQVSGAAIQRVYSTSAAAGPIYPLGTWNDTEGTAALEIQVSSETGANSGSSTYRWQGGYAVLSTGSYYRLLPFNDGRGHGDNADSGLNLNAWGVYVYTPDGSYTYGIAVSVPAGRTAKTLVTTVTELKRGMTYTPGTNAAVASWTTGTSVYSHRNLMVESLVTATTGFFNGTVTANSFVGPITGNVTGSATQLNATANTNAFEYIVGVAGSGSAQNAVVATTNPVGFNASTGNVGIGTSSPGYRLDVAGTTNIRHTYTGATGGILFGQYNTTGDAQIQNQSSGGVIAIATNNTERMRIDSSGNVGIGNTAPQYKFDVGPVNASQATNAGASGLIRNASGADLSPGTQARIIVYGGTGVDSSNWGYFGYDSNGLMKIVYGKSGSTLAQLAWGTTSASDGTGTFTETMRLDNNGRLGIGTTSPSALLHVSSGTNATLNYPTGTWAAKIYQQNDITAYNGLIVSNRWQADTATVFEVGNSYGSSSAWGSFYKVTGVGTHIWGSGGSGTERLRITINGGISFGASGTAYGTAGQILQSNGDAAPTWVAATGATGATGNPVFFLNDQTVTGSYSIPSGKNAGTFGPITVNSGVTVTVPSGSVWTIV